MRQNDVVNDYFAWLYDIACENRFSEQVSYKKLLVQLHNTPFTYRILMDENRIGDGLELRDRFADLRCIRDIDERLDAPCSVLEVMLGLAIRCEQTIMDDPKHGDRTATWFWNMVGSLGLGGMRDDMYDRLFVRDTLKHFLQGNYQPNGKGGLFTIKNCDVDLRDVEIWTQMLWYLETVT